MINSGGDPDQDPDMDADPDRDTGKTCLGAGMHCASAYTLFYSDIRAVRSSFTCEWSHWRKLQAIRGIQYIRASTFESRNPPPYLSKAQLTAK